MKEVIGMDKIKSYLLPGIVVRRCLPSSLQRTYSYHLQCYKKHRSNSDRSDCSSIPKCRLNKEWSNLSLANLYRKERIHISSLIFHNIQILLHGAQNSCRCYSFFSYLNDLNQGSPNVLNQGPVYCLSFKL